jgi:hypothetical protein
MILILAKTYICNENPACEKKTPEYSGVFLAEPEENIGFSWRSQSVVIITHEYKHLNVPQYN